MLPIQTKFPEHFFKEEIRCNYRITKEIKQLWAVLLDLMLEFNRVCKKNNIQYALDSGTLLGAIRHKGFIPWDDDVDVIMLRSEFDKLCKIAPKEFKQPYFWQTNETDPGSARRHAQLRNSATTGILKEEMKNGVPLYAFNQGIFLDVFILDEIPDETEDLNTLRRNLTMHIPVLWELRHMLYSNNSLPWIQDALTQEAQLFDKMVSQYNGSGYKRVANFSLNPQRKESTLFNADLFTDLVDYEFEGFLFPAPRQSDAILTGYYGNWHEYVKGNNTHGNLFVDTEKTYLDYLTNCAPNPKDKQHIHPLAELIYQRNTAWNDIEKIQKVLHQTKKDYESVHQAWVDTSQALKSALTKKQNILDSKSWRIINSLQHLKEKLKHCI